LIAGIIDVVVDVLCGTLVGFFDGGWFDLESEHILNRNIMFLGHKRCCNNLNSINLFSIIDVVNVVEY
jgi:hypothetical protein